MFASGYAETPIIRRRRLQSFGAPRYLALLPSLGAWTRRTETVHTHSAIMISPVPAKLMVVEWTEDVVELHGVDF
jgi:hypothetical protein